MSVIYVGPVIYSFGTEEQKRRWLPGILDSSNFWAQGYSEPEAGSDLTALSLSAVRDGGDYVLNGSKIWTSMAHWADWIFCLVRTAKGARKEQGISFLCLEMASPGVAVHPILSMDGSHHLNRVTFDDVRVPAENLIGEEGRGWDYARFLLANERLSYAHTGRKRVEIERLRRLARARIARGEIEPSYMTRLARCNIDVLALETLVLRMLSEEAAATPQMSASLKILATETAQRITELQVELVGPAAFARPEALANTHGVIPDPDAPNFAGQTMASYLFERAQTIYGGSTEIQKNIMARALLRGH
jgi:alkylation response protein AidB-like acyl-CoA dehydrogenase